MIEFKNNEKTLNSYVEMGVKFNTGEKRDQFQTYSDFQNAIHENYKEDKGIQIKSSSHVEYDNQEAAWRKFATKYSYDGLKELANAITKLSSAEEEGFSGMEGLAALTGNKELFDNSDYANVGSGDQLITSMFYGGNRMKQWKKYAKPYIKPQTFVDELSLADDYDSLTYEYGIEKVERINGNTVKVYFSGTNSYNSATGQTEKNPDTAGSKKKFHEVLENGDELFDFNIAEDFDSNVWTISVK